MFTICLSLSQVDSSLDGGHQKESGSVIEEERACFSPAHCKGTSSETIRQTTAISQTPLRPPQALTAATASFVPYLHISHWSPCEPPPQEAKVVVEEKKKKHRRKKKTKR